MTFAQSRRRPGFPVLLLPWLFILFALGCGDEPSTPTCASSETTCGGACVDLAADPANCGACGAACGADEACSNGACTLDCVSGQTACGGTCVDTTRDLTNCGTCGTACDPGEVCSNGTCALSCQTSLAECGGTCVDTTKDLANCGACGTACEPGEVCSNGTCALSCQTSLTVCDGVCANLATDVANCGACGTTCDPGEVCSNGTCTLSCQVDLTDCGGICVDLASNLANCGSCGNTCAAGEVCSNGACSLSCQTGLTDCNGLCVELGSSSGNCGECGAACGQTEVCSNAKCESTTPVDLQFVSISDWHGQLDPITVSVGVDVGGASVLSAYFKNERLANPNTLVVTAGDAYFASPPLSSFFNEEPAVMALSLMGIDADTFGNHNFDKKLPHLQSMIDLATYDFVSSNLNQLDANLTGVVSPYKLVDMGGIKVALIGLTNPEALTLVGPGSAGTITVGDPIVSAMAAKTAAEAEGAKIFVALAHMGASICTGGQASCTGPLIDVAKGLSGFDIVFGDHTDILVDMVINGARVVENRSKGLNYARVALTVVPLTGVVAKSSVTFVTPLKSAVTPDPAVDAMLAPYRASLAAKLDGPSGVASDVFPRGNNVERLMEVAIGNLMSDAMRIRYGTQLALCNGGGLRAPLPSTYLPANTALRRTSPGYAPGPPYDLVTGDAYAVLPFGNIVVTRTVTGAQLWAALENGISALPGVAGRFPQISGFGFSYSQSAAVGSRVTEVHLSDGTPIAKDQTAYTMALFDFLNTGGDGYTMFADGQGTTRELAADVLAEHIETLGTINPTIEGRIVALP
jgi:5'-nucleotidase